MKRFKGLVPSGKRDWFDFDLDDLFNFPAIGTFFPFEQRGVKMDICDAGNDLVVEAELPGFSKDEIQLNLEDNYLTLSAERKEEIQNEQQGYLRRERSYGKIERTIALPCDVDAEKIEAKHQDGLLTIRLPKVEPKEIGRRIDIQ